MFEFRKHHPFGVEAFFRRSVVLTFAAPVGELAQLVPSCLSVDTFEDRWGFVAVAIVQTRGMRPKGFPQFLGQAFTLIGYRIFVRYRNSAGRTLRGLYILRSVTNRRLMRIAGNLFTRYQYASCPIPCREQGTRMSFEAPAEGLSVEIDDRGAAELPGGSPFADWKEARRFAGPMPFTFTYEPEASAVLLIEGVREEWRPRPVEVVRAQSAFIDSLGLSERRLANAFLVENVPYSWKKGVLDPWRP